MYKIYKIIDNTNDNIYIGITTKKYLCDRLAGHNYDYKKTRRNCTSSEILKNNDYKIELIETTDDKTRERYWIENSECVNKIIPGKYNYTRRQQWRTSMGGNPFADNMSFLKIDVNLFLIRTFKI